MSVESQYMPEAAISRPGTATERGARRLFLENPNLAAWAGHSERLAYYRGHRDGRWDRKMSARKHSA